MRLAPHAPRARFAIASPDLSMVGCTRKVLIMRHIILIALASSLSFLAACNPAPQGSPGGTGSAQTTEVPAEWHTNMGEALRLASETGRPLLVNFTGSDWCPPCMQLKRDVFDQAAFQDFAARNLVLLELDFPRAGNQPPELRQQNEMLQQRFRIEGFPTLLVLDGEGRELQRHVGYMRGGPSALANWVERARGE
jgi:protein disulfide-isomerase